LGGFLGGVLAPKNGRKEKNMKKQSLAQPWRGGLLFPASKEAKMRKQDNLLCYFKKVVPTTTNLKLDQPCTNNNNNCI